MPTTKTNSTPPLARTATDTTSGMMTLVVAPIGRDNELICDLLSRTFIDCEAFPDVPRAIDRLDSAGVLLIAEEALTEEIVQQLRHVFGQQPPWSDLPLILLTKTGEVTLESQRRRALREPLGNVLLLERPIRPETLISSVRSALRARARQYQIRNQVEQYRRAEEALRKSEKLAVAGRLAASVAHEINNPLEAVTNLLYLMRITTTDPNTEKYAALAEQELSRVTEIAKQTLQFYREPATSAPAHVSEVLESVLQFYGPRFAARNVVVQKDLRRGGPVTAGAGELRQLFANLIGNALDAMRGGGKLWVRTRPGRQYVNGGDRMGVRISVADTGTGIVPHLRQKIFEPFVTTKGDTGTGLGLWVTSEIVQKHAGSIRLRSRVHPQNSGTVFHVFLPRAADAGAQQKVDQSMAS